MGKSRADRTTSLCLARVNISEPSSSVMDIDGTMRDHEAIAYVYAGTQQHATISPKSYKEFPWLHAHNIGLYNFMFETIS